MDDMMVKSGANMHCKSGSITLNPYLGGESMTRKVRAESSMRRT